MSLCPIPECRKVYCDHTVSERGQTQEEIMAPLTPKETAEREGKQSKEVAALSPEARRLVKE